MYAMQRNKRPQKQAIASSKSLLAPVRGWNARDPEAAMPQGYAITLDNWWPTPTEVVTRPGAVDHATGYAGPTRHLMSYEGVNVSELFACTDTSIYDVTVSGAVGTAVATVSSGKFVHRNFRTTGTSYLFAVNGVDSLLRYDGITWLTVAGYSITGGGTLLTSNITQLNVFKRRLFFIEKESLDFFYLPVDAAAGVVSRFPLGGIFGKGGRLVAMGTWTIDGGAGSDDFAVFITSKGQLAVYQGTNPDSASEWRLQGVYDLSEPLGKKCFLKFGGDMLYIGEDGVYPLSKALLSATVDSKVAVTDNISNAFSIAAKSFGANFGWEGVFSFRDSILLFNIPTTEASTSQQYAMNIKNKAWARITGWDAFCWALFDNNLYMGMSGKVAKAWTGESDFDNPITSIAKGSFDYLGGRGRLTHVTQLRPMLRVSGNVGVDVAIDVDFANGLGFNTNAFSGAASSLWDSALWNTGVWGGSAEARLDWITVSVKEGYAAAPRLRVFTKNAKVAWFATDLAFELGAIQG